LTKALSVQAVDVNVKAAEAGIVKWACIAIEQYPICRQGNLIKFKLRETLYEYRQVRAKERLPASDTQFSQTKPLGNPYKLNNLIERKLLCGSEEVGSILRHAVKATYVAAIGDADSKIIVYSPEGIDKRTLEWRLGKGEVRS
jgi:hypothetical protein